jgi:hypothetical protein
MYNGLRDYKNNARLDGLIFFYIDVSPSPGKHERGRCRAHKIILRADRNPSFTPYLPSGRKKRYTLILS